MVEGICFNMLCFKFLFYQHILELFSSVNTYFNYNHIFSQHSKTSVYYKYSLKFLSYLAEQKVKMLTFYEFKTGQVSK